jgi:hypothetical protein
VTFVLKGHLENARIGYIRAASLLARVREEKLWKASGMRPSRSTRSGGEAMTRGGTDVRLYSGLSD